MSEWAEGYDAGYATGTADGAKATNDFTKRRITELETFAKWARDTPNEHDLLTNPWASAIHYYANKVLGHR